MGRPTSFGTRYHVRVPRHRRTQRNEVEAYVLCLGPRGPLSLSGHGRGSQADQPSSQAPWLPAAILLAPATHFFPQLVSAPFLIIIYFVLFSSRFPTAVVGFIVPLPPHLVRWMVGQWHAVNPGRHPRVIVVQYIPIPWSKPCAGLDKASSCPQGSRRRGLPWR